MIVALRLLLDSAIYCRAPIVLYRPPIVLIS